MSASPCLIGRDALHHNGDEMPLLSLLLLLSPPPLNIRPRPADIHAKFFVLAYEAEEKGAVFVPMPRIYRGQVPVGFQIKVKPESMVKEQIVRETADGDAVLEIRLQPMKKDQRLEVEWRAQLIVDMEEDFKIPADAALPSPLPSEAAAWLRPSAFVQSDHPDIIAAAAPAKRETVAGTIREAWMLWYKIVGLQTGMATELSSVTSLTTKGSCTSEANLLAAMLRSLGIPARLLACYPTYAGRPYDTHYIVEAYCGEKAGWKPVDPSWVSTSGPFVAIRSVEDENLGGRRIAAAAGVPYLSLTETSGALVARGTLSKNYAEHAAKFDQKKALNPDAWLPAQDRWRGWLKQASTKVVDLPANYDPKG